VSDTLVLIPVFNEAATIGDIVERARLHGPVLVVDDGSTDATAARAAAAGAEVVTLEARRGKGAALRRGFAEARRRGVARVVTLDGDGQHEPDEIPRLLKVATEEPAALVIGGRLTGLTESPGRVSGWPGCPAPRRGPSGAWTRRSSPIPRCSCSCSAPGGHRRESATCSQPFPSPCSGRAAE